jgi:cytochrome c-type biogenesis protein CcmH
VHKLFNSAALRCFLYVTALLMAGKVYADPAIHGVTRLALELHVTELTQELRCLVCQNQTIADSQAQLAIDLKTQVREKLAQGATDKDVIDFMVQRYGDFVLYRPPLKPDTLLLWFGPFLLLAIALILLMSKLRQGSAADETVPAPDMARAAALLTGEELS